MKKLISIIAVLLCSVSLLSARTLYVSKNTGNNRNDASQSSPLKNLQKAIDLAADGDVIKVAEGNYFGTLDCGTINVTKPVQILGGYNTTFTEHDVLKYKTFIQPTPTSNGTVKMGTLCVDINQPSNNEFVLDGFIIDRGNCNAYSPTEGKPQGVQSGLLLPIAGRGVSGANLDEQAISSSTPTMRLNVKCPATIRNCAFLNSFQYAILGSIGAVEVVISNNIFINQSYAAVQIATAVANGRGHITFAYNTVLFSWARLKDLADMGYGYRFMNGVDTDVHHCIIGCSTFAGLDRTYTESKDKEAIRKTGAENNLFFLNRQADLTLPGGGMFLRIWADQFEDVEQLYKYEGNRSITDPKIFGGKLNEAYLKGFINMTYKETKDYDANSSVNQFRAAMGMNTQGKITSQASMFANRYPWQEAIKLFGAVSGYGAQTIR